MNGFKLGKTNLVLVLLMLLVCFWAAWSQNAGTGGFEIDKVNQAVVEMTDADPAGQQDYSVSSPPQENYAFLILRITLYLVLTIVLIFAVAWVVRRAGLAGASRAGGGANMDILEVLSTGQNRNMILVRVTDSVYLLGQTPNSIVLIEKIEGQKAIEIISSGKGGASIVQFKDAFNSFIGKIRKTP